MTDRPATPTPQDAATSDSKSPYLVLARKYRPQSFADMIGQDALVRTLKNAIETDRLPHAVVLTGVRGVGKTTTARIIAKAINYTGPDGSAEPTVGSTDDCETCRAIAEDRHPDVMEMDAASRTGVDDIRELIEGVRYRPVSARYKVYIIDEVHMLSKNAFNALLKTLEEPPPHVMFIFATTEIRKVPVTVLSRCMRFDLRRVEQPVLAEHFAKLCEREGVDADEEALQMIARAADGSVRDGLSLLDQAIALGETRVETATVKQMLGLTDRAQIYDLFEATMTGDVATALEQLGMLYRAGGDPVVVLQDMLELTHTLTRVKVVPDTADAGLTENERLRGREMAGKLNVPVLTRVWQMLLKGISETQQAASPLQAAEMVLIRLAYAADLPAPADLVRRLSQENAGGDAPTAAPGASGAPAGAHAVSSNAGKGNAGEGGATASVPEAGPTALRSLGGSAASQPAVAQFPPEREEDPVPDAVPETASEQPPSKPCPGSFEEVVSLAQDRREARLATQLKKDVHLVRFEPGRIEFRPGPHAPKDLAGQLGRLLGEWTGQRWVVSVSDEDGQDTLEQQEAARQSRLQAEVLADPRVQAVMQVFPGAEISRINLPEEETPDMGGDDTQESGLESVADPAAGTADEEEME
ncbi:DNA polymerase III subunit gamma/tau [Fodinicurvata fenggangensis]|uniref:DNA polymerase III subunit gamma/tau n=1 Tax=Fodinicurvata fenggangensis TaxID=1121830 RepID=UPI00068DD266|nr:DNA polymerase III subunit gamma/tau [Fodinicurvata fenggangensis]